MFFSGEEFRISYPVQGPEDDKDLLPRIKKSFAQNHDNKINERGFTITAVKSSDAGIFECGIEPKHGSGIIYQAGIRLEVKTPFKRQNTDTQSLINKRKNMNIWNIFGRSYPKWAVLAMTILVTFILILGVAGGLLFLRHRRQKKKRRDSSDRESLLDVVSSDEDEVMEYQRQVDKQQQQQQKQQQQLK